MIFTNKIKTAFVFGFLGILPQGLLAAEENASRLDLTGHWVGWLSIGLFTLAYVLVMAEEFTHLRKPWCRADWSGCWYWYRMKVGILPRRSSRVWSFTADFVERNRAQGKTDRQRSIVDASSA